MTAASTTIVQNFYAAVGRNDIAGARKYLDKDLKFFGLFQTYNGVDEYIDALTGLLSVTERLEVKTVIGDRDNAAVFFELVTKSPVAGTTLVAEWHEVERGKIVRVRSAFDGRLFAPMFESRPDDQGQSESDIKALNHVFAAGFVNRDAKQRASVWTQNGTLAPPTGGFFKGRAAIEKDFERGRDADVFFGILELSIRLSQPGPGVRRYRTHNERSKRTGRRRPQRIACVRFHRCSPGTRPLGNPSRESSL